MTTELRDAGGRLYGRLKDTGNEVIAENANGRKLGFYKKNSDQTFKQEPYVLMGKGNQLGLLFNK